MTPGMIELGKQQWDANANAAKEAATICDEVLIVGPTNREALLQGLRDSGFPSERTHICPTREDAFSLLKNIQRDGDNLLIENDLTDLYETVETF